MFLKGKAERFRFTMVLHQEILKKLFSYRKRRLLRALKKKNLNMNMKSSIYAIHQGEKHDMFKRRHGTTERTDASSFSQLLFQGLRWNSHNILDRRSESFPK